MLYVNVYIHRSPSNTVTFILVALVNYTVKLFEIQAINVAAGRVLLDA